MEFEASQAATCKVQGEDRRVDRGREDRGAWMGVKSVGVGHGFRWMTVSCSAVREMDTTSIDVMAGKARLK